MKQIKQIREGYNLITEKEESDTRKLTTLVRAGLFDAKKLPLLKRAMEKDASKLTPAERKVLMELLDSLMSEVLHSQQVYSKVKQNVMNEELLDEQDRLSKFDPRFKEGYPSDKDMPVIIILKRKAIRVYPDNQKVALYYSQALDKYVTIPFGPNKGSLNEAKDNAAIDMKLESVRKDIKAGAKSVKSVSTEENDVKSRFRQKLNEKKELRKEDAVETLKDLTPGLGTYRSGQRAYDAYQKGDYGQAALHGGLTALQGAGDIALLSGVGSLAGVGLKGLAAKGASSLASKSAAGTATKGTAVKAKPKPEPKKSDKLGKAADAVDIGASLYSATRSGKNNTSNKEKSSELRDYNFKLKAKTNQPRRAGADTVQKKNVMREENIIDSVKHIVENNINEMSINMHGNKVTINSSIANKINNLYESLNDSNKDRMISMLNESTESFKKIVEFAVRQ